jgi:peroxiredoxin
MSIAWLVVVVGAPMLAPGMDDADSPKARYEALVQACNLADRQWTERWPGGGLPLLKLDEETQARERVARYEGWPAWAFLPEFLSFAEKNPDAPEAADALFWIAEKTTSVPIGDKGLYPSLKRALELMESRALDDDARLFTNRRLSLSFQYPSPATEHFLRVASERTKDRGQSGRFTLALAELLINRAHLARKPYFDQPKKDAQAAFTAGRLVPEYKEYIRKTDREAANAEAEKLLRKTIEEYGDIVVKQRGRETTLAVEARDTLRQLLDLAIGRVGPEIEREDLDGKAMKLSDFRGKVVVLSFWGAWCGPCLLAIPHERELVARLEGRPFVLLGVNSDRDRRRAREAVDREKITWRSWYDVSPDGPISEHWQAVAWPTFYVLDAKGVIRSKFVADAKALDETVDMLLKEMQEAKDP